MLEAHCGCQFRTPRSIPPERPCPEGTRLLYALPGRGFDEAGARYMRHMKAAWRNLFIVAGDLKGDLKGE